MYLLIINIPVTSRMLSNQEELNIRMEEVEGGGGGTGGEGRGVLVVVEGLSCWL